MQMLINIYSTVIICGFILITITSAILLAFSNTGFSDQFRVINLGRSLVELMQLLFFVYQLRGSTHHKLTLIIYI